MRLCSIEKPSGTSCHLTFTSLRKQGHKAHCVHLFPLLLTKEAEPWPPFLKGEEKGDFPHVILKH